MCPMTISKVKEPRIWRGPTIAPETLLFSPPPVLSSHLFLFSRYLYSQPFCCFHPEEGFHCLLPCSSAFIMMDIVVDIKVQNSDELSCGQHFSFFFDVVPGCGKASLRRLLSTKCQRGVTSSQWPTCRAPPPTTSPSSSRGTTAPVITRATLSNTRRLQHLQCTMSCLCSTIALWYFGYSRKNTLSWENNTFEAIFLMFFQEENFIFGH